MFSGIDFGTSNSSLGIWRSNRPELICLEENDVRLPTALFTSRPDLEVTGVDPDELAKRVRVAKAAQTKKLKPFEQQKQKLEDKLNKQEDHRKRDELKQRIKSIKPDFVVLSDAEIVAQERGVLRRELMLHAQNKAMEQDIEAALYSDSETVCGTEAIKRHLMDPWDGYFIRSPKSFLGGDLNNETRERFAEIVTRLLAHMKLIAEKRAGFPIESAVLGRPVNFHGTRGEKGNAQALGILRQGASAAGFEHVEFLYEPIAAALEFERHLTEDEVVLVLDCGGGTTDCTIMNLGPGVRNKSDREGSILAFEGIRAGGIDLDIALALHAIMPEFGLNLVQSNGLPVPNTMFTTAVRVNDVNDQSEFLSARYKRQLKRYLSSTNYDVHLKRLNRLRQRRLNVRLNRSAELAKIHLSERDPINLPLRYIDENLVVQISRADLFQAIRDDLDRIGSLMDEVIGQAQTLPSKIFVTGGTAKSPVVRDWLHSKFPDAEVVEGDYFGSVASGLTVWARKLFQ